MRTTILGLQKLTAIATACVLLCGCAADSAKRDKDKIVEERINVPTKELHKGAEQATDAPSTEDASIGPMADLSPAYLEYQIGAGDLISFRSFDDETLGGQFKVRYDGCISLPWIPDIVVAGLTREEAMEAVREAYKTVYSEPQVNLTVLEPKSKSFTVMGDIQRPGAYQFERPTTLLEAINEAGGLRTKSQQSGGDASFQTGVSYMSSQGQLVKAFVIRHIQKERHVYEYNLREMTQPGAHASDAPVFPGDVIYIPESVSLVYFLGEVNRPSVFALSEGMTLLQVLARSGGFNETTARMRGIVLMREIDKDTTTLMRINLREILRSGGDVTLEPGDVIYLPRKRLVNLQNFVQQFTGSISPLMSLYSQAFDTYYTKERFDRLFGDTSDADSTLSVLQDVRDLSSLTNNPSQGALP